MMTHSITAQEASARGNAPERIITLRQVPLLVEVQLSKRLKNYQ